MIIFENIGVGWGLAPTFYFADFSPCFKWELTTFDAVNVTPIPKTSALLMLRSAALEAITGRGSLFDMH